MGRRRRKVVKITRKKLPDLFPCPRCGKNTVNATINKKENQAVVICSNCSLNATFHTQPLMGEVDAYCLFIDRYYEGEPLEESIVERKG